MFDEKELTDFQLLRCEINGVHNLIEFDKRVQESGMGDAVIIDNKFKVKINATHIEITATIVEAFLENNITIFKDEKIHASKLE